MMTDELARAQTRSAPALDALKPCPFCGGEAALHENDYCEPHEWDVYCSRVYGCGARGRSDLSKTKAIRSWNRRAPSEQAADVERAEQVRSVIASEPSSPETGADIVEWRDLKAWLLESDKDQWQSRMQTFSRDFDWAFTGYKLDKFAKWLVPVIAAWNLRTGAARIAALEQALRAIDTLVSTEENPRGTFTGIKQIARAALKEQPK